MRNKVHFLLSKIFDYSFHFRQGSTGSCGEPTDWPDSLLKRQWIPNFYKNDIFWLQNSFVWLFQDWRVLIGSESRILFRSTMSFHRSSFLAFMDFDKLTIKRSLEVNSQNPTWNRLFRSARSSSETPLHNLKAISHFELFQNLAPLS